MIRALAKGALLSAVGRAPGGVRAYRTLTRDWMGSQATHVDKLRRVWPGYVEVWRTHAGLEVDGAATWVYEGGWTPFPFLVDYLVTANAGVVTNRWGTMLDRYLARAVNGAVTCELPTDLPLEGRRADLEALRWAPTVHEAIDTIGGRLYEHVAPARIPLDAGSVDLCHSAGTLEHHRPEDIRTFLGEARRILRPGGVMSHVFDHRDHLHHADPTWPYLAHLGWSPRSYALLFGTPLLYHNRLLPPHVAALFDEAGFERIAIRRMVLPSRIYCDAEDDVLRAEPGIERSRLAAGSRDASDADLRTAAAHYLYRRP